MGKLREIWEGIRVGKRRGADGVRPEMDEDSLGEKKAAAQSIQNWSKSES